MAENPYAAAAEFRAELRRFLRRSEDCARKHGITPRQHLLLLQIAGADRGSTTVSELVTSLALTQSAVTELVQRAETAGLVTRSVSRDDGRVVDLTLTPEGERKLRAVHESLGPERQQLRHVIDELDE
ncbi:MAG TPA: MarR family transcriptional regulator [Gaiellaceae bacterium]